MTFVIPSNEKNTYLDNAKQRANRVVQLTQQVITQALAQGYALNPVTDQQRRDYGILARNAKWVLTLPDGTLYFAENVFMIGKRLSEGMANIQTMKEVQ